MDIRMPGMDGIEATRQITTAPATAATRVLVLTTFNLDEYVFAALRAGASGFLLKDTPPGDLLAAVRVIAAGDALLSPSVTRQLIGEFARQPEPAPRRPTVSELTVKEAEVLALIGLGLSNAEICERLYVSMSTTKTHVGRLLMNSKRGTARSWSSPPMRQVWSARHDLAKGQVLPRPVAPGRRCHRLRLVTRPGSRCAVSSPAGRVSGWRWAGSRLPARARHPPESGE